ncbi:MAG: hypothetical protein Q9162_002554 [Coniocarpon cinnabarinum]
MDPFATAVDAEAQTASKLEAANHLLQEFFCDAKLRLDTFNELRQVGVTPSCTHLERCVHLGGAVNLFENLDRLRLKLRDVDKLLSDFQQDAAALPLLAYVAGHTEPNADSLTPSARPDVQGTRRSRIEVTRHPRVGELPSSEMARMSMEDAARFPTLPYLDPRDGTVLVPLSQDLADSITAAEEQLAGQEEPTNPVPAEGMSIMAGSTSHMPADNTHTRQGRADELVSPSSQDSMTLPHDPSRPTPRTQEPATLRNSTPLTTGSQAECTTVRGGVRPTSQACPEAPRQRPAFSPPGPEAPAPVQFSRPPGIHLAAERPSPWNVQPRPTGDVEKNWGGKGR